jgi:hypothetical protein
MTWFNRLLPGRGSSRFRQIVSMIVFVRVSYDRQCQLNHDGNRNPATPAKQSRRSGAQIDLSKAAVRSLPPLTAIDRSGTGRSRDRENVSQQARIEFEAAIADLANPNSDADLWSTLRAQVEILDFEAGLDRGATLVHLWHA